MITAKPTIIKANALYRDKKTYKVILLWKNNLDIPNIETSHVEIHLIEDKGKEKIRFSENIIDTNIFNVRFETWGGKGNPSFITIRTFNYLGLYSQITISASSPDINIGQISVRNGYLNFNEIKNGINGLNLGWDYPTPKEENSLFCYSILISGYSPQERQTFYIPNTLNNIFIPYSSIPLISKNRIKNVIVYAINNNEQSGEPFIYGNEIVKR